MEMTATRTFSRPLALITFALVGALISSAAAQDKPYAPAKPEPAEPAPAPKQKQTQKQKQKPSEGMPSPDEPADAPADEAGDAQKSPPEAESPDQPPAADGAEPEQRGHRQVDPWVVPTGTVQQALPQCIPLMGGPDLFQRSLLAVR